MNGLMRTAVAIVVALLSTVLAWSASVGTSAADPSSPTIDGQFSGTGPVAGGTFVNLQVTGRGGVPSTGVGAVAVNVAVTNPSAASFLTVFPAGSPRPTAANLNFTAGQTVPNMVIVKVGENGQISLFNYAGTVDVVVDVQGWFREGPSFTGLDPARLLDTRPDHPTIDGDGRGMGPVASILHLDVTGRGGVPAGGVGAVVLNVAVANPTAPSFLTVFPTGSERPTAANLNYVAGQVVSNLVVVKVGANGLVSLFNYAGSTDIVVDVLGWFPEAGSFVGVVPARMMDTRAGYPTIDQSFAGLGPVGTSGTLNLSVVGRAGVPADAGAVALNVTVTNPTAASFLTVWPAAEPRPTAANLNFTPGQTVPNMVIAKVGAGGQISMFNLFGNADIVVDVLGWFPAGGSFVGLTPARLMDSRTTPASLPPPPPPVPPSQALTVTDYVEETGLRAPTTDGKVHTFGKPCVADLNRDGLLDIVWSNHYERPWDVHLGLADGTWARDLRTRWTLGDNHSCTVADFDGDGRLDIFGSIGACRGTCSHAEELWLQRGDGTFDDVGPTFLRPATTMHRSRQAVALDLQRDGRMDLFIPADNSETSDNRIMINTGSELVATAAGVEANNGRTSCTVAHDFDGDGFTDVALCQGNRLTMYRNDRGTGFVENDFGMGTLPRAQSLALADVDLDGSLDLVVVTKTQLQIRLHRAGQYGTIAWSMPLVDSMDVVTPDVNGDGRPDIYVVQASSREPAASASADILLVNDGSPSSWTRVPVPQSAGGRGDSAVVLPEFRGSNRDAILVSNGYFNNRGPRQVLAAADL